MRMRTRSPVRTSSGSVPGNTRLLKVKMLKSIITVGSGVDVPGSMNHSLRKIAKSRSMRRGGVPRMEDEEAHHAHRLWTISSKCGWYICVPCCAA